MSGLQPITWEKSSLQTTLEGTQETRLRSTPRLKMQPSSTPLGGCSHRIRATELPTVPNLIISTFITQPSHRRNQPQSSPAFRGGGKLELCLPFGTRLITEAVPQGRYNL